MLIIFVFLQRKLKKLYIMKKIFLIEIRFDFLDGSKKDWFPLFGYNDYQSVVVDIKELISDERENRKIRELTYGSILYKIFYKLHEIYVF